MCYHTIAQSHRQPNRLQLPQLRSLPRIWKAPTAPEPSAFADGMQPSWEALEGGVHHVRIYAMPAGGREERGGGSAGTNVHVWVQRWCFGCRQFLLPTTKLHSVVPTAICITARHARPEENVMFHEQYQLAQLASGAGAAQTRRARWGSAARAACAGAACGCVATAGAGCLGRPL